MSSHVCFHNFGLFKGVIIFHFVSKLIWKLRVSLREPCESDSEYRDNKRVIMNINKGRSAGTLEFADNIMCPLLRGMAEGSVFIYNG